MRSVKFATFMLFLSTLSLRRATQNILCVVNVQIGGFLSTLSLRRATAWSASKLAGMSISIHALLAESDPFDLQFHAVKRISIHALLAESDLAPARLKYRIRAFLSTLSLRRATAFVCVVPLRNRHFYPRSPCGERLPAVHFFPLPQNFYPRSPCGERRVLPADNGRLIVFLLSLIHISEPTRP